MLVGLKSIKMQRDCSNPVNNDRFVNFAELNNLIIYIGLCRIQLIFLSCSHQRLSVPENRLKIEILKETDNMIWYYFFTGCT